MSDILPIGQLIEDEQHRDAIHIAVAPVICGAEELIPGQRIGFIEPGNTERVGSHAEHRIGIVDPFLTRNVFLGQRFWMFLLPNTITSLRHDWTHPAFAAVAAPVAAVPDKAASEKWLREWAEKFPGWSLDRLLESAENKVQGGYGHNSHSDIPNGAFDALPEFWKHYEIVTGVSVAAADRDDLPYYCSC